MRAKSDVVKNFLSLDGEFEALSNDFSRVRFWDTDTKFEVTIDDLYNATLKLDPIKISLWCASIEAAECITYQIENYEKLSFLVSSLAPETYQFSKAKD